MCIIDTVVHAYYFYGKEDVVIRVFKMRSIKSSFMHNLCLELSAMDQAVPVLTS